MATSRPRITYILEPRFPGGTSSAVAEELAVAVTLGDVTVHAISSVMFRNGHDIAPRLRSALDTLGLDLHWDAPSIGGDIVILHNPSFLKFQSRLIPRIMARKLVVVTHENFLQPGGSECFDVAGCLAQIDAASFAGEKILAPVSNYNRDTVETWIEANTHAGWPWRVSEVDWFNICEVGTATPTATPRDRRGRHSRPGAEKFPSLTDLDLCFPGHAEANVLLGADLLIASGIQRPHWSLFPFRALEIAPYFEMIDFMVYHTAPTMRESFGRVLSEAIAAGKVVIADPVAAKIFGGAVVPATPGEVDAAIARFVEDPKAYAAQVARAREILTGFSSNSFAEMMAAEIDGLREAA